MIVKGTASAEISIDYAEMRRIGAQAVRAVYGLEECIVKNGMICQLENGHVEYAATDDQIEAWKVIVRLER